MDELIKVKIDDGKNKTYNYREELKSIGFKYSPKPSPHWYKEANEEEIEEIRQWAFKRRLAFIYSKNERNDRYRERFFKYNKGFSKKELYLCSYCGKVLGKDKVSVDHLISINKAQTSWFYVKLMKKLGYKSINDKKNLVPACKRCNSRKGPKAGLWALKGFIGRYTIYWLIIRIVEIILLIKLITWVL